MRNVLRRVLELGVLELGDLELGDLELGDLELGDLEFGALELGFTVERFMNESGKSKWKTARFDSDLLGMVGNEFTAVN